MGMFSVYDCEVFSIVITCQAIDICIVIKDMYRRTDNMCPERRVLISVIHLIIFYSFLSKTYTDEPREPSGFSDWLRAGRQRGPNSSLCRAKNFLITASRPVVGPI
jgi:hypothetical protein